MTAVTPQGTPKQRPDRPPWLVVSVVGIAGAILGYLLGAAGSPNEGDESVDPATTTRVVSEEPTTTSPPPTTVPAEPSLAARVPGFEGTLVIHLGPLNVGGELVRWLANRSEPSVYRIPPGTPFEYDVSGSVAARLVRGAASSETPYPVLETGPSRLPDSMRAAALSVRSFAWHVTFPMTIAWVEGAEPGAEDATEASWVLMRGGVGPQDGVLVAERALLVPRGAHLVAWDTWGYLLRRYDAETETATVWLVDPEGDEVWRLPYGSAQVSRAGDVLLFRWTGNSFESVITDVSGTRVTVPGWPLEDNARIDGTGTRIATLEHVGVLQLVRVRHVDGTVLHEVTVSEGSVWEVQWAHDRFVLATGETGSGDGPAGQLLILDTEDGSVHRLQFDSFATNPRAFQP